MCIFKSSGIFFCAYVLQMWNSHANLSHPCNHANIISSNSALPDSLTLNFLFCIWNVLFYFVIKCMSYLLRTRVLIHLLMWKVTSLGLCLTIDVSYHSNDSQVIHTYLVRLNVTRKGFNKNDSYHNNKFASNLRCVFIREYHYHWWILHAILKSLLIVYFENSSDKEPLYMITLYWSDDHNRSQFTFGATAITLNCYIKFRVFKYIDLNSSTIIITLSRFLCKGRWYFKCCLWLWKNVMAKNMYNKFLYFSCILYLSNFMRVFNAFNISLG